MLDCIKDVLFLDDAVIVYEVNLLLQLEDGQFLKRKIEDKDAFHSLTQQVEQRMVCQLQVVLIGDGRLLHQRITVEVGRARATHQYN
jgi:hypothetical protein